LKFDVPRTWQIQAEAGVSYDATFCFNRFFGFRAEVCFPYRPIVNSRPPLVELPTSYMDWTSLHRNLGEKEQRVVLQKELDGVLRYHGVMVVNFHNTYLNKMTFPTVLRTYKWLLDTASAKNLWVATAEQCVSWWNLRANSKTHPRLEGNEVRYDKKPGLDMIIEAKGEDVVVVPALERSGTPPA